ncbi:hypothetical protein EJ05DRAFT_457466 [Pseudovirgaria hyperparasitica]|uniref:Uncharacterized protein n=1 Tax=Pseudovirgaria hyperparasitica TaxID=470096 RepID=A0A6A6VTP1_9PEZI|nr:uncharacterized protein EJ05DRAFT_457466 [Pseudovirgaria hyperparasitica]KAF2754058.1 hypothetical protein EJ05DRAFT_457466 [Pseudovirgaria hyperparasitica]
MMDSNPWPKLKNILPTDYFCETCNKSMKYKDHKAHLFGKGHKAKVAALSKPEEGMELGGTWDITPLAAELTADGCFNCGQRKWRVTSLVDVSEC